MIFRFFKINDVWVRAFHIDLVNDNLKRFDQSWKETLMALEKKPQEDLLEALPTEPKSYSKLKAMATNVFGRSAAKLSCSSERKRPSLSQSNPSRASDKQRPGYFKQWSSKRPCSRGANCAFKHGDRSRGSEKETSVRRQDSLRRKQKSATGQAQAREEKVGHKKSSCETDKNCDNWNPPCCV